MVPPRGGAASPNRQLLRSPNRIPAGTCVGGCWAPSVARQTSALNPEMSVHATVIVCTYNRAELLVDTLAALRRQTVPGDLRWEVVVVDNNSRDKTREVVARAAAEWPLLRYEFEGRQGLSYARNHGVRCARGAVLLFTDDDVLPETDWVECTLTGMAHHGAAACGGYIAPIWEEPPPTWLTTRFHGFLAIRMEAGDSYVIRTAAQAPYGANMAMRADLFQRVGLFDTSRGRVGAVLASGEDGEFFERVLAAGEKVVFLTDARVHHRIEAFRTRRRYFRRWRMHNSRNLAQTLGMPGKRRVLGVPLYVFVQFLRAAATALRAKVVSPPDEAFYKEILVWHFVGLIEGLYKSRA